MCFEKKLPTTNFQKYAQNRRNFCRPPNLGGSDFCSQKVSLNPCACFLCPISVFKQLCVKFHEKFLTIFGPMGNPFDPRGISGGRQKFLTQKKISFQCCTQPTPKILGRLSILMEIDGGQVRNPDPEQPEPGFPMAVLIRISFSNSYIQLNAILFRTQKLLIF